MKVVTEGPFADAVPGRVFGLTAGGRGNAVFLLDTHADVVHWADCPDRLRLSPSRDPVDETSFPDDDWRLWSPTWAVVDFFAVLKGQFRALRFVPLGERRVVDTYAVFAGDEQGMIPLLQSIYREHGWPDLEMYKKEECLKAVRDALTQRYPRFVD